MDKIVKEIIDEEKQVNNKANLLFDQIYDYCRGKNLNLVSDTLKELTKIYGKAELLTRFQKLINNYEWDSDYSLKIIYPIIQNYYYPDLINMGSVASGDDFNPDIFYTSNLNDEVIDIVFSKEVYEIKVEAAKRVLNRIAHFIFSLGEYNGY